MSKNRKVATLACVVNRLDEIALDLSGAAAVLRTHHRDSPVTEYMVGLLKGLAEKIGSLSDAAQDGELEGYEPGPPTVYKPPRHPRCQQCVLPDIATQQAAENRRIHEYWFDALDGTTKLAEEVMKRHDQESRPEDRVPRKRLLN